MRKSKAYREKMANVETRVAEIRQRHLDTFDPEKMNFSQAILAILDGYAVRLPEWTGYWFLDKDGKMKALTRNGEIVNTLWTEKYKDRTDFTVCKKLLGFDWVINALKNNKLVTRKGWNGKGMFLFVRPADAIPAETVVNTVKSLPQGVKDYFEGVYQGDYKKSSDGAPFTVSFTSYICMKAADGSIVNGWSPSQTDLLSSDWFLFEA